MWPISIWFLKTNYLPFSQDCSNGWSMGRARLHFLPLLLCCAAQSNLFARGGGGVCNHLLDYGHLQVYLWMIIKQYINVHFGAEQFNCLSCFFLYTFSPSATFWLSEGIWECLIGVWTPDSRICSVVWECLLSRGRIWNGANPYVSFVD